MQGQSLYDVKFYPYPTADDDQIFAVVGVKDVGDDDTTVLIRPRGGQNLAKTDCLVCAALSQAHVIPLNHHSRRRVYITQECTHDWTSQANTLA